MDTKLLAGAQFVVPGDIENFTYTLKEYGPLTSDGIYQMLVAWEDRIREQSVVYTILEVAQNFEEGMWVRVRSWVDCAVCHKPALKDDYLCGWCRNAPGLMEGINGVST